MSNTPNDAFGHLSAAIMRFDVRGVQSLLESGVFYNDSIAFAVAFCLKIGDGCTRFLDKDTIERFTHIVRLLAAHGADVDSTVMNADRMWTPLLEVSL